MLDETSYLCESCGEETVIPIDISAGGQQQFVEDCPVCCHPNVIYLSVLDGDTVETYAEHE